MPWRLVQFIKAGESVGENNRVCHALPKDQEEVRWPTNTTQLYVWSHPCMERLVAKPSSPGCSTTVLAGKGSCTYVLISDC